MKQFFVCSFLYFFVLLGCPADSLTMMCEFNAKSADSLGFFINGRPVATSKAGVGSYSGAGPYSECFKAGTNVLSVRLAEKVTPTMLENRPELARRTEEAKVRIEFRRYVDGKLAEKLGVVDESFALLPTNLVFTVPEFWPLKQLAWEGESLASLTEQDKTEIKKLIQTISDASTSYEADEAVDAIRMLERLKNEYYAALEGMSLEEVEETRKAFVQSFRTRYSSDRIIFENLIYEAVSGANLVKVSASDSASGGRKAPVVAHRKDGSGGLIGPEWFSKIDGKWWIVP